MASSLVLHHTIHCFHWRYNFLSEFLCRFSIQRSGSLLHMVELTPTPCYSCCFIVICCGTMFNSNIADVSSIHLRTLRLLHPVVLSVTVKNLRAVLRVVSALNVFSLIIRITGEDQQLSRCVLLSLNGPIQ
jgi:hypothetical protein